MPRFRISSHPTARSRSTSESATPAESPAGPYSLIAAFDGPTGITKNEYRDEGLSPHPVPTGLTVSTQDNALSVTWSPVSDALSGYRLHWSERSLLGDVSIGSEHVFTTCYQLDAIQSGSVYTYAVQVDGFPGVSPSESVTAP